MKKKFDAWSETLWTKHTEIINNRYKWVVGEHGGRNEWEGTCAKDVNEVNRRPMNGVN